MSAAEIAERSGIPEDVLVEKFGLRGKHIAAPDEHVSDLAAAAATRLLDESGFDPTELDVVMYYGSMWRDYAVWQRHQGVCARVRQRLARDTDRVARRTRPAARGG